MINKRLLAMIPHGRRHLLQSVAWQWLAAVSNIATVMAVTAALAEAVSLRPSPRAMITAFAVGLFALAVRAAAVRQTGRIACRLAASVKRTMRVALFEKLLALGSGYAEHARTSEVVQLAGEGVDQLEMYVAGFMPQLLISFLSPLTLFAALAFVDFKVALILLLCVPLIPLTIAAVQTTAKKWLKRYWGQYTSLGDTFLENLQGLTTLKIYQADEASHRRMNEEAERFRQVTMRLLTFQLNSIGVMDLIAYGGAAAGIILAVLDYRNGQIALAGCLAIVLLSADFFLPMRKLGSFFHVAMNGLSASDQLFSILDLPEPDDGTNDIPAEAALACRRLSYAYGDGQFGLSEISLSLPRTGLTALVGESGCGKSTLARLLAGRIPDYEGSLTLGGVELRSIRRERLARHIVYLGFSAYLSAGTVRETLLTADGTASEQAMNDVLERVRLREELAAQGGLDARLTSGAANLSGGQRQRLALARALLRDASVYIFDEVTSNVDVESETHILREIRRLAETRTVLMITHRLANVEAADKIHVLKQGRLESSGSHGELLAEGGGYSELWQRQRELETIREPIRR